MVQIFIAPLPEFHINGHVLPDTTNIENAIMPPPPRGNGPGPEP